MPTSRPHWHWLAGIALAAALFGAGMYLGRPKAPGPEAPAKTATAPPPAAPEVTPDAPKHYPIEADVGAEQAADAASLPMLAESDAAVLESLAGLLGLDSVTDLIYPEHVVERVVVTLDNLPRKKVAVALMPVKPAAGALAVQDADSARTLDPKNYARYDRYLKLVDAVDARQLVGWYRGFYPLFQQAYRELGYPDRYFNDRLVEVIDHLVAAPNAPAAPALTHPEAFYEFADPALESLSAGHKMMLRIGPDHAAKVKAKLREIRREVTGESTPR